ncbi:16S rRNA (guanine(527)-N(7))-methyltransferase RsmG [Thermogemmatispora sp.]|uniref:16S rRNA (guanine(527)-N(7))-methyltransferase RsmG n=1 Tax=Thermogemmatispora sp. TaxID=1968838 RepID=UPI001D56238A|nr:16S rRNA (guanine(527)-N(7))-methyltransferase RsmG [Thermogemmatispora sp.]MBX5451442.1 16S rRNA (guanine(527)-N(7))-methyltransferase RsmG [Thermogemmatispora sp.]
MSEAEETLQAFVQQLYAQVPQAAAQVAQALARFLRYREELLRWNERVNLTAIIDPEEVLTRHFLDSLAILTAVDPPTCRLLDIGSGAGFPGLPLKIVRPAWTVTLLEATARKVAFLHHICQVLELEQVTVVHGRAELLGHDQAYRGTFDVVTARAVAALPVVLEYAAPYCRVGGTIVLPRKGDSPDEMTQGLRAAEQLGLALEARLPVTLSGLNDGRYLLVWRQHQPCPPQFPRNNAAILKRPAGE